MPDDFRWDLWLGPVPDRPYHPAYTHAVFRGWYDFGTGALGDMGHYSFHQIFKVLKLGSPTSVEAGRSQYWAIEDFTWHKKVNTVAYPRASVIHWEFPERGEMPPVRLHWYDGGMRPPMIEELEADGRPMPEEGMLFVGDRGKILADFTGGSPQLIPEARMRAFQPPAETVPGRSRSSISSSTPATAVRNRTPASPMPTHSRRRSSSARSPCAWSKSSIGTPHAVPSPTPTPPMP